MSSRPALGVGGVLFAAAAFTVVFVVLRGPARRAGGSRLGAVRALALGAAVLCLVLFGAAFRHYGGDTVVGQGNVVPSCDQWWAEMSEPHGVSEGEASPACRRAARRAVPAAVVTAGIAGMVAAAASFAWNEWQRRRFDRALRVDLLT